MRKLDGKVALVTGASKGIGAGVALSLAKEGAAVAVNYASDREGADRVVEKIKAAGGKAIAVQGSVTSSEEIDRFFSETVARGTSQSLCIALLLLTCSALSARNEDHRVRNIVQTEPSTLTWNGGMPHERTATRSKSQAPATRSTSPDQRR